MQKTQTEISLEGLEFFAYHGYYPEEQRVGNTFLADVKVVIDMESVDINDLQKTVDYELLYAIVEKEMNNTAALLETVVSRILDEIFTKITQVRMAEVAVSKLNPPINGKCAKAKVLMCRSR